MTRRGSRAQVSAAGLLQQEINDLFQHLAQLERADRLPTSDWCPPVDVFESRERLVVVVEVPGLPAESLRVAFRDGCIVISGERKACAGGPAVSFLCLERPSGRFERTIPLEGPLDVPRARATLGGGVLTVAVPRLRERRGGERIVAIEREPGE